MELTKERLVGFYQTMATIRTFESKTAELFAAGKIPGFVHLYIGEEAVATGVCANLADTDFITSTHRGHGHLIAKGGKVDLMMAELYGKATGYCKGKGGSMHIADVGLGILGANGIVGAGQPIATGAAFAAKYKKSGAVVACFFGDGASNRGTFHESLNLASIWNLPVVFICENNMYGISYCQREHMNICDISDRASAYGIPGVTLDGNDVVAVYEATAEAFKRARNGDGPSLIECKTWRWRGHFEGDPGTYKDPAEQAEWIKKDPIPRLAKRVLDLGSVTQTEIDQMNGTIAAKIGAAVQFAESSPNPVPEDVLTDVYAN